MLATNKTYSIGIDIGGTNMRAILYDGERIVGDYALATPKDTLDHFMVMLYALVEPLIEKAKKDKVKIKGIGLGLAGVMDYQERRILKSPNLPIIDKAKIADKLEIKTGIVVRLDNDANCFVRAEALRGAGRKYRNIYGITIGTGIGGGWWHHGEVYRGAHGGAGEPSVMIMDAEKGIGLESAYHKLMHNNPATIAEEAYRGDVLATKFYQEFGQLLGIAFANITNLLDPEVFVLGGSVVDSGDLFLSFTKNSMVKHIESSESAKNIKILKSKLGKNAGAIGAALLIN